VVNEVFTPTSAQVAEARGIIEAFDRAAATGSGAFALENGQFVDRAVVERARALVELADTLQRSSSKTDK
jgi:citrate lyase subunit beta/citryl-CoA lyase